MKKQIISVSGIPAIVWGEESEKVYIYVHGKMSCKEYAEGFANVAEKKNCQVISFDLPEHGERTDKKYRCDVFNAKIDLDIIADYAFSKWKNVGLFACSIGAYFSLNTYKNRNISDCLFVSPIADMKYLINQMFLWFGVSEKELAEKKEIDTPVDPLRWDYYQYVLKNPVEEWNIPTAVLYAGKDNLQSREVIAEFCKKFNCSLTISENSEHPFMSSEDIKLTEKWFEKYIIAE